MPNSTSGYNNTAVGLQAAPAITTANTVVCLGYQSGTTMATGSTSVYLGALSTASGSAVSGEVVVGSYNMTGKGTNTAFISGGNGGTYNGANTTTWATTSDQRLKKNIVDNNDGLNKIIALRVRNFEYRLPKEVDAELSPTDAIQKQGVQLGVIAQEIKAVLPECVTEESTGVLSVQTDNLIWYAINAIKEQQAIITQLTERITALEGA